MSPISNVKGASERNVMGHEEDCIDPHCGLCEGTIQMSQPKEGQPMSYTKEPWEVRSHGSNLGIGAGELLLADWLASDDARGATCRANATRIVLCVNALAGMTEA